MSRIVGLLLLAGLASGVDLDLRPSEDEECCNRCIPERWAGTEGIIGGYNSKSGPGAFGGQVKVAYDAVQRKIAAFSKMYAGNKEISADVWMDYRKRLRYVVYGHDEKICNVTRISDAETFPPHCLPKEAKKVGNTYFGEKPWNSLDISSYQLGINEPNAKGSAYLTFTKKGFIPISESIQGEFNGVGVMEVVGFTEVTQNVNPKYFKIPKICEKQEHKAQMEGPLKENPTMWEYMQTRVSRKFGTIAF